MFYGVSVGSNGQSALIEIDPKTGMGQMIMNLSREYEGLAWASGDDDDEAAFYAVSDNMLWKIDREAGTETAIGQGDFFDIEALEFADGKYHGDDEHGDDDDHHGDDDLLEGYGLLYGFSDIDNALLLIDPSTGTATEVDSAIRLMDMEGIVFLKGSLDPKISLPKVAFD